jgi:3-methylcrotonyl-CoA carboxylase alpha subunit
MFKSLLIANRGEIACRIMKTAKKLHIQTVAIYTDFDAESKHVTLADLSFRVSSYNACQEIVNLARDNNIAAIHPGYGFLSENATLAAECEACGIIFVGPKSDAIAMMASKKQAKEIAVSHNVPVIPGYYGDLQDDTTLLTEAKNIGFPLLIKAALGGGGRGMRVVNKISEFAEQLASAKREAYNYCHNDSVILEKHLSRPRHIEVQILGDKFGNILHLFDRDCSIQRRYQKIIEEAPAFSINPTIRQQILEAAVTLSKNINYYNAGTVEFLVEDKHFYFIEMNTRLQVEHPVTEMITGLDLVEWQLRIANNEALNFTQQGVQLHGHALECRVYAEDPENNFLPTTGTINFLCEPNNVRIDTGITNNTEVKIHYDPLLSKIIVWNDTRAHALIDMHQALNSYHIGGITTNLPFLRAVIKSVSHDEIFTTDFLKTITGIAQKHSGIYTNHIIIAAAALDYAARMAENLLAQETLGWRLNTDNYWRQEYLVNGKYYAVSLKAIDAKAFYCALDCDNWHTVSSAITSNSMTIDYDTHNLKFFFRYQDELLSIFAENGENIISKYLYTPKILASTTLNDKLQSQMPAIITKLYKNVNDEVIIGEPLIILESMKIEHTIYAHKSGRIQEIFYALYDQIEANKEILTIVDL